MNTAAPEFYWMEAETLRSHPDDTVPLITKLCCLLEEEGWADPEIQGVRLGLEEALVNAIKHGNQFSPTKSVTVRYYFSPRYFRIEICDEGSGFDPESVPDPLALENLDKDSGHGLLLMRHYMDEVQYSSRGTCVFMSKQRHHSPALSRTHAA